MSDLTNTEGGESMGEKRATVLVTGGTSDIAKATIKMMYDQAVI